MYGSLHEFDIRSLLEWIERGQYTGQLLIETASVASPQSLSSVPPGDQPFWLLFLSQGQITYAVDNAHLQLQRLQDYLRRYQVEATVEHLPTIENFPLPTNFLKTTGRALPEYNYLWVLLEHHVLTPAQARQILKYIVHETLFDLLALHEGRFIFESNPVLQPQLTAIEITPVLRQVTRQLQQWKEFYPDITSPDQCPLLTKNNELQQALTTSAYRSLAVACQGQLSLRRIARYLNKSLVTISQALYPYIQRGSLQLLPAEELGTNVSHFTPPTETISPSNQVVCICDSNQVTDQIEYSLKQKGFEPIIISDPVAGLSTIAKSQPCLVFCALEMSNWSGEQLSQTLRHIPTTANIPIILLIPENPDPIRLMRAELLGITEFLAQPIQETDLLRILSKYLEEKDRSHQL